MKPTPSLCARLRFSTKDVGKGFYRGNRTGSMGAHTPKGGYLIDYRKVRSYNVPDLTDFKLTPYVTRMIHEKESPDEAMDPDRQDETEVYRAQDLSLSRRQRALQYLDYWRQANPIDYQRWVDAQTADVEQQLELTGGGRLMEAMERLRLAQQQSSNLQ